MNLEKQYPILLKLLSVFRCSQQKTCLSVVAALLDAAEANSFAIAAALARCWENWRSGKASFATSESSNYVLTEKSKFA